jgi:hypothetical protein
MEENYKKLKEENDKFKADFRQMTEKMSDLSVR